MTTELVDTAWNAPSRLVYLAEFLRIPIPSKILNLLPTGKILGSIVARGIHATAIEMGIPEDQLMNVYEEGRNQDDTKADEQEYRYLVGKIAEEALEAKAEDLNFSEKLRLGVEISEFVHAKRSQLIEYETASLTSEEMSSESTGLPTFDTGFQPLDILTDGIAQTLVVLMARPGHGKTSTLLTLMGKLRETNVCSSIWYFSLEMPLQMMKYRAKELLKTVEFVDDDIFYCGQYTPTNILSMISENPDPDRIIIYDSPDALGGGGDQRRFVLEDLYRDLVQVKANAKAVFTASQPNRASRALSLDSLAESWAKAWYADMVLTLVNQGRAMNSSMNRMRMETVKHRFGVSDRAVEYNYDFNTLKYADTPAVNDASEWNNSNELREAAGESAESSEAW